MTTHGLKLIDSIIDFWPSVNASASGLSCQLSASMSVRVSAAPCNAFRCGLCSCTLASCTGKFAMAACRKMYSSVCLDLTAHRSFWSLLVEGVLEHRAQLLELCFDVGEHSR